MNLKGHPLASRMCCLYIDGTSAYLMDIAVAAHYYCACDSTVE